MSNRWTSAVILTTIATFSTQSFAWENRWARERAAATEPSVPTEQETAWYGWQVLLADGASFALMASAIAARSPVPGLVGVGGYVLGGPLVHALHQRPLQVFQSLGL